MKSKISREFLGTLITAANYREILDRSGRFGIAFHNKHLKAYKRGQTRFTHGTEIDEEGKPIGPKYHTVQCKTI